jgi:hypothetical protein
MDAFSEKGWTMSAVHDLRNALSYRLSGPAIVLVVEG